MSVADHLLPVFSFRPNWAPGIVETIDWLTALLPAKASGAEQRMALRLSPRRRFEAQIDLTTAERSFLDLFLRRFMGAEFMLPLWHDRGVLDAAAGSGATSLSFDTADREFVSGGMALLMGEDALNCEAVRLNIVSAGGATLVSPTLQDWSAGVAIHPLRRARIAERSKVSHPTDGVGRSKLSFELAQANDFAASIGDLATFGGVPILSPDPNWSRSLDVDYFRDVEEIDNRVGLKFVADLADRSVTSQIHGWLLEGRSELAAFYALLYYLGGRWKRIWLPTFTSDLLLAADAAPGATFIDVVQCGLDYADFPDDGRDKAISGGGEVLEFSTLAASPGGGVERLNLADPLVGGLTAGDALSWLDIGRLDSDSIELLHHTDSDGATRVEAPFRTIADVRDGSAAGAIEIPETEMNDTSCGGPESDVCGTVPYVVRFIISFTAVPTFPEESTYSDQNLTFYFYTSLPGYGPVGIDMDYSTTLNSQSLPAPGTGIDAWECLTYAQYSSVTGSPIPPGEDDNLYVAYYYDSDAKTMTIDSQLDVDGSFFNVILYGHEDTVLPGDTLIYSVTQTRWGESPVTLAVNYDSGRFDFSAGGTPAVQREMQFEMIP